MDFYLKKLLLPERLTCHDCMATMRKRAPNCLLGMGNGKFLLLDRDYKPLGSDGRWANYDEPKWADRLFDESELNLLAEGLIRQNDDAYLYDDRTSPHLGKPRDRLNYVALLEAVFTTDALDRIAHLVGAVAWRPNHAASTPDNATEKAERALRKAATRLYGPSTEVSVREAANEQTRVGIRIPGNSTEMPGCIGPSRADAIRQAMDEIKSRA
jgi:hypothetical protein